MSELGAMGKLHSWDEYVTVHASTPAFTAFDRWLGENMESAHARGPEWTPCYRRGGVHAFVYSSGGTAPYLSGALAPSKDRAGRNYPLFAAAEIEPDDAIFASLETLPLVLEDLWNDTSQIALAAAADGSVPGLGALLTQASTRPSPDLEGALSSFREWTDAMELDELSSLLFGDADAAALGNALRAAFAAVAPHRGVFPLRTRLSLKLPLGRAGGAAVCFWLGVAQRALDWERVVPSFFWTHDGDSGTLLLHVGTPPRTTLAQLWMPAPAEDVVDLVAPSGPTEHDGAALESALARAGTTVGDLFGAFDSGGGLGSSG